MYTVYKEPTRPPSLIFRSELVESFATVQSHPLLFYFYTLPLQLDLSLATSFEVSWKTL